MAIRHPIFLAGVFLAANLIAYPTAGLHAQDAIDPKEIDDLIARVEAQIQRMNKASEERDEAILFLEEQIDRAASQISAKGETETALRQRAVELDSEIDMLSRDREELASEAERRATTLAQLETQVASLEALLAGQEIEHGKAVTVYEAQLAEALSKQQAAVDEMATLQRLHAEELEANISEIETLQAEHEEVVKVQSVEIADLRSTATSRTIALGAANGRIDQLTAQVRSLVEKLSFVQTTLSASEAKISDQGGKIRSLNSQLATALQARVEELEQYRSDFFGELRQILGNNEDILIVGDRFVLPSNLFFSSGSARLSFEAQSKLREIAAQLKRISERIPAEISWILRVDGHTDDTPLKEGARYVSNWELSTARAIAVVKFLIEYGIDPKNLAATGFGEYQPLDPVDRDRNRRIEFKLTEG